MLFLSITHKAHDIIIGLYDGPHERARRQISYKEVSAQLIPACHEILVSNQLTLRDLHFIAANSGPGPYTTLRSILTTVNGLGYATQLPLVTVNGLEAFLQEHHHQGYTHTFALMNAFCGDVYYGILDNNKHTITTGTAALEQYLDLLKQFLTEHPQARILFIGNGFTVHHAEITRFFDTPIAAYESIPQAVSSEAIARAAYQQWQQQRGVGKQVIPWYGKPYRPLSR